MASDSLQVGGKLLGQGLYGCAFSPPLKCVLKKKYANNKSLVGKITDKMDAQNELFISHTLQGVPGADKYFVLMYETCTPMPRAQQKDKDMASCESIKDSRLTDKLQLIMPFAGKPLRIVPHNTKNIRFFELGQHLLEAGALLLSKHVVHTDLHSMNVLVDSPSTAKYIDFGLSWSPDSLSLANLNSLARTFNPAISQEPPEISVLNGLWNNIPKEIAIRRTITQKLVFQLMFRVTGIPIESQERVLREFVDSSVSFHNENWLSFYTLYWSKVDAWAIGVLILTLYADLLMDFKFELLPQFDQMKGVVLRVIRGLCNCDPSKRLDAAEALELWNPNSDVLKNKGVSLWLQKQKKLREQIRKYSDA
jgi:hypothetical protein